MSKIQKLVDTCQLIKNVTTKKK
uniref:Uncharacterized protein n=1 Tax=Anguilla anguilla TaxID=7936 RepID=A0A0E9PTM9_ANGAN